MNVRDEFTVVFILEKSGATLTGSAGESAEGEGTVCRDRRKAWMEMERQPAENEILFRALERVLSGLSIKEGKRRRIECGSSPFLFIRSVGVLHTVASRPPSGSLRNAG